MYISLWRFHHVQGDPDLSPDLGNHPGPDGKARPGDRREEGAPHRAGVAAPHASARRAPGRIHRAPPHRRVSQDGAGPPRADGVGHAHASQADARWRLGRCARATTALRSTRVTKPSTVSFASTPAKISSATTWA